MLLGEYLFSCSFIEEAYLPPYKGSTFRGAFGSALKKVCCAVRQPSCDECMLRERCIYARTFEAKQEIDSETGRRSATIPHPYVIKPPLGSEMHLMKDDSFDFTLLLFGDYNDFLPYFVYAFDQMGERGIGKKNANSRGRFAIKDILHEGKSIYAADKKKLTNPEGLESVNVSNGAEKTGNVKVTLQTPLRLKFASKYQNQLPFHLLVRALLRRISSLFNVYGQGEPDLDYKGLISRANDIEIAEEDLAWYDWKRYSNRQDQTMLMGGLLGTVTYKGELGPYIPLLSLGKRLNIGKQTAFGLGNFDFEPGE